MEWAVLTLDEGSHILLYVEAVRPVHIVDDLRQVFPVRGRNGVSKGLVDHGLVLCTRVDTLFVKASSHVSRGSLTDILHRASG